MDAAQRAEREREELPISDEVRAELDRRLAAHRRNPNEALSWDELQRRLREGLR